MGAQIEIEQYALKANYPYTQFSGNGFAEISQTENKEILFTYDAPKDGVYLIDFRYSNGSGPWNTDNKCALRSLYVNKDYVGAVVFPLHFEKASIRFGFLMSRGILI
jgi:hypothetical protein